MQKLSKSQITELLMLRLKHLDWSLRQISNHTRRNGKRLGVSHQIVKHYLDAYPRLATLKVGDRIPLSKRLDYPPLPQGEAVQIADFTDDNTILVSHHHYNISINIPSTDFSKK